MGTRGVSAGLCVIVLFAVSRCHAQVDPQPRELIESRYDAPLEGQGPLGGYGFFLYNDPDLFQTNAAIRVALSPTYLDSELGFKRVLFPYTDVGLGLNGGGYGDNYYEVRQGDYIKSDSFNGYGGGPYLSIYQLINPGMRIPLNFIARGGYHYSTYHYADQTSRVFVLPEAQNDLFTRVGLRLAGREPVLYPNLGMELSVWYQRVWRLDAAPYGIDDDRNLNPDVDLYWAHGEINYTFKKSGQRLSFAATAGGSANADRLSAWRLGGDLPLIEEYPLVLPGYYYEELTAQRFVHLYAAYDFPLLPSQTLKFRLEAATANVEYLPGFDQSGPWQSGAGCALTFAPKEKNYQIVLRYGYGFNALRHGEPGAQSVGLLFQYDFEAHKHVSDPDYQP
jgi:hypothetical protein